MILKPKSSVNSNRALLYRRYTEYDLSTTLNGVYKTADNKYWQFDTISEEFVASRTTENYIDVATNSTKLKYKSKVFYYNGTAWGESDFPTFLEMPSTFILSSQSSTITKSYSWKNGQYATSVYVENNYDIDITITHIYFPCAENVGTSNYLKDISTTLNVPSHTRGQITFGSPYRPSGASDVSGIVSIEYRSKNYGEQGTGNLNLYINYSSTLQLQFPSIQRYQLNKYYYVSSFDYMLNSGIEESETQNIKGNIMNLQSFSIKYFDDDINLDHDDLLVIENRLYSVEGVSRDIKYMPKPYKVYFANINSIL